LDDYPKFEGGSPSLHISRFLEYLCEVGAPHENVQITLFIYCFPREARDWIKDCCETKGIFSFIGLVSRFIEYWRPSYQMYEEVLQDLTMILDDEGFTTEIVEELREAQLVNQYPSNPDHSWDEGLEDCDFLKEDPEEVNHKDEMLTCAPPSDEAIQDPILPAQEEENEVNHFPFQVFDDTLFYDSEGEEVRESLDELDPSYCDEGEDVIEEESHEDEVLRSSLPFDEVIQAFDAPTHEEVNTVSCFPFQDFDDALFCDLESEKVLEEPLDVLNPSCYDKGNDMIDNIDEFIHVGRCKWDVVGSNEGPIYDMEGHLQMFPLQLSYEVTTNSDIWQQGDGMVTYMFQTPKDDLMQCFHDDFQSYLEDFDEYSFKHSDLLYEEYCQPPLCSDLDKGEDIVFLKQDTCDKVFQLPSIPLSRYVTKDAVGKHVPCIKFSLRKVFLLEFKGRLNALRRSLLSQSFNYPLRSCQSSSRFLLVPSQT
jgi:hypothetical protein